MAMNDQKLPFSVPPSFLESGQWDSTLPPPAHRFKLTIMSDAEYEWEPRPPNLRERIIAGVLVTVLLVALGSEYAGWGLFAGHEKQVMSLLILIGVILLRFAPAVHRR